MISPLDAPGLALAACCCVPWSRSIPTPVGWSVSSCVSRRNEFSIPLTFHRTIESNEIDRLARLSLDNRSSPSLPPSLPPSPGAHRRTAWRVVDRGTVLPGRHHSGSGGCGEHSGPGRSTRLLRRRRSHHPWRGPFPRCCPGDHGGGTRLYGIAGWRMGVIAAVLALLVAVCLNPCVRAGVRVLA